MYQYAYEPLETDYHAVIDRRAVAGWRFVGFVPTAFNEFGGTTSGELVFEKEE